MNNLSIKVTIGNRVYPLTIRREEEELIRKAVRMVNDNIKELEHNYAVRDKQDLLAMTALFYANKTLSEEKAQGEDSTSLSSEDLQKVHERLDTYLSNL